MPERSTGALVSLRTSIFTITPGPVVSPGPSAVNDVGSMLVTVTNKLPPRSAAVPTATGGNVTGVTGAAVVVVVASPGAVVDVVDVAVVEEVERDLSALSSSSPLQDANSSAAAQTSATNADRRVIARRRC